MTPLYLAESVKPTMRMKHFTTNLLLILSIFLAGCAKPDVKYSDLRPATTATVSGDAVTIHRRGVDAAFHGSVVGAVPLLRLPSCLTE